MLEKSIVVLQVVGHLAESGLPFQFKGGSSLLLRLNPIRRLSIDVDIVTQATAPELQAVLARIGRLAPLIGHEHDAKRDRELPPKKHYRLFYRSIIEPKTHTLAETLNDSIESGFLYSQLDLRGGRETEHGVFIRDGVLGLQNHLVNLPFRRDEARTAAGKAACVAAWILHRPAGVTLSGLRYQPANIDALREAQITAPWLPLNRLKGGNPAAFHYWNQAQRILSA